MTMVEEEPWRQRKNENHMKNNEKIMSTRSTTTGTGECQQREQDDNDRKKECKMTTTQKTTRGMPKTKRRTNLVGNDNDWGTRPKIVTRRAEVE